MAKVYALKQFTAPDGVEYEPEAELDLPRNTDKEKYDFDQFIAFGIVTQNEPKTETRDSTDESGQRSSRRRS